MLASVTQGGRLVLLAKDQDQYQTLPAILFPDGKILTEWRLSEKERERLIRGEHIRLWTHTFGHPFQPVALEVTDEHKA